MNGAKSFARTVGSLWFASVFLALWAVAMACATVYESQHSLDQALFVFYKSWWFELLLALLAVNIFVAVVVRFPFTKRQIGFVLTHGGILLTLGGALVSRYFGIEGRVGIPEGATLKHFMTDASTLTVTERTTGARHLVDLADSAFQGFDVVDHPNAPALAAGDVGVVVERFLPDSTWHRHVLDDNPESHPAIEVELTLHGAWHPAWVFPGETASIGDLDVTFRMLSSHEELEHVLKEPPEDDAETAKLVRVEYAGAAYDIPLEACQGKEAPVGDTAYRIRVLRYMPHAIVGDDKRLTNVSDRPVNPAIEAEIIGPDGREKRFAFARFPDFASIHGKSPIEGMKVVFVMPDAAGATAPIEVLSDPDGEMVVRFRADDRRVSEKVTVGTSIDTPWEKVEFVVSRRFDHARVEWRAAQVEPVRETRVPAVRVKMSTGQTNHVVWLQKFRPRNVLFDGKAYGLSYGPKQLPLGFGLKLDRFRMPFYPGERRPRSFESHITITDPATGDSRSRVISMNRPVAHAGYTLYQSSYNMSDRGTTSYLSVSHDPGRLVVFAGYVTTFVGMVIALGTRLRDQRRVTQRQATEETS